MDKEFLDQVSKLDWKALGRSLMAVCVFWVENTFGDPQARLPKGYTHDDVVRDALLRSINRKWTTKFDENQYRKYLFGAIRSVVSNLAKSSEQQLTDRRILTLADDEEESSSLSLDDLESSDNEIESQVDYGIFFEKLETEIRGKAELEQVLTGIRLGLEPIEIATEMNKDVKEIYQLKRQLFGIGEKVSKSLNHERKVS
jgi:hypothetical protein